MDFEDERRSEVFDYIQRRYGKAHVAKIITYGTSKLRSGVDDLCRTLEQQDEDGNVIAYGPDVAAEIKKNIPVKMPDQNDPSLAVMQKLAADPESFREAYRDRTEGMHKMAVKFMEHMNQYPEIEKGLAFIDGLIRNFGQHAAAIVITDDPITDHIPVYYLNREDTIPVTAFSMKEVDESLQMLKIDVLGLSTMTVVRYAEENINRLNTSGKKFNVKKIPLDDPETFKMLREGHTNGVFQISGGPITGYTKRVRPWKFRDVVDILGLFRPGPLEALVDASTTMAEKYIENADEQVLQRYLASIPENLKWVYKDTKGILIYQEQIIQLAQLMAGYTMGGADVLRRGIGKKDTALLQSLKAEFVYGTVRGVPVVQQQIDQLEQVPDAERDTDFNKKLATFKSQLASMKRSVAEGKAVEGCVARGYDEQYSLTTFDAIQRFSGYSFNLSHSLAYGLLAYWTAYLKVHYPVEFMAAQLTVQGGDEDKTIANVQECRRLNIKILPPDINRSRSGFNIELVEETDEFGVGTGRMAKAIRFGVSSIKGIGGKVVEEILDRPELKEEVPEATPLMERVDYLAEGLGSHQGKLAGDIQMNDEHIITRQKTAFASFDDFYHRVDKRIINKAKIEILIKAGCFDFDEPNRHTLLNRFFFDLRKDKKYDGTKAAFDKEQKAKKKKLAAVLELDERAFDVDVLSEYEKEFFGFYLSHHPFEDLPYAPWHEVLDGQQVDMGGKIKKIKKIKTKKKDDMCFLTLETAGGIMDVTVFPNQFKQYQEQFFTGNIAIFRGKKQNGKDDKSSLLLDQVLKVRKKKFRVEQPEPEPVQQVVAPPPAPEPSTVRPDPLADLYTPPAEPEPVQQAFDLAGLFER